MSPADVLVTMSEAAEDLDAQARFATLVHEMVHEASGCPLLDCPHEPSVLVEAAADGSWRRCGRVE